MTDKVDNIQHPEKEEVKIVESSLVEGGYACYTNLTDK